MSRAFDPRNQLVRLFDSKSAAGLISPSPRIRRPLLKLHFIKAPGKLIHRVLVTTAGRSTPSHLPNPSTFLPAAHLAHKAILIVAKMKQPRKTSFESTLVITPTIVPDIVLSYS
ncbi:hypothetical protein OROHE_024024 [Orobanche hederae]